MQRKKQKLTALVSVLAATGLTTMVVYANPASNNAAPSAQKNSPTTTSSDGKETSPQNESGNKGMGDAKKPLPTSDQMRDRIVKLKEVKKEGEKASFPVSDLEKACGEQKRECNGPIVVVFGSENEMFGFKLEIAKNEKGKIEIKAEDGVEVSKNNGIVTVPKIISLSAPPIGTVGGGKSGATSKENASDLTGGNKDGKDKEDDKDSGKDNGEGKGKKLPKTSTGIATTISLAVGATAIGAIALYCVFRNRKTASRR
ncbi:hypothetical protein [Pasteuria penetrans]|uniref:hypothetical protein n=1 Tax=Pasteuria penetrans TaxID=86005 RepID=UPI000FB1908B|nr:hypothetical protein [Pasteuria penetrans]